MQTFTFGKTEKKSTLIQYGIGLLNKRETYSQIIPKDRESSTHFIVTETTVDELHAKRIHEKFRSYGYKVEKFVSLAGEAHKNIQQYIEAIQFVLSHGVDKHSLIITIGGGVANNLGGFVASTVYRGLGLVHIGTTVMSQLDAAIDTKQAVNFSNGKNLVGSMYAPRLIVLDPEVLSTLSRRHILNGVSEGIKHALCQDQSFYDYLMRMDVPRLEEGEVLGPLIQKTVELKVQTLNADKSDDYNEMCPQYGHCVGHALEHCSNYEFLHGEAIAIGMCVSAQISYMKGFCSEEDVKKHFEIFQKFQLPTFVPTDMSVEEIVQTMRMDKHHLHGLPHLGLIDELGSLKRDSEGSCAWPIDYELLTRALKINQQQGRFSPYNWDRKVFTEVEC